MDLVTGDAPQPGETPPKESNPWTFSDPDTAFWRGEGDKAAEGSRAAHRGPATGAQSATLTPPADTGTDRAYTGEAGRAQAAGVRDATEHLLDDGNRAEAAEHDHDHPDEHRFSPTFEYPLTTAERTKTPPPDPAEPLDAAAGEPDIMILPEPDLNRPTVALDRGPVPGQPPSGLSRLGRSRQPKPPAPLLESSPFWLTDAERAERGAAAPAPAETRATSRAARRRRPRTPRRPATGLLGLVALALIGAFFAWVSAEPFWLAVGHGDSGLATVAQCTGDGVSQRCAGRFDATDGQYAVSRVTLLGVGPGRRDAGTVTPARMVSSHSRQAYVGGTGLLVQLRWVLGFLLVLLCGFGCAALTGTHRLPTAPARRIALILSLAGPLLLLAGFLAAAY